MSLGWIIVIIVMVLGVVVGNLLLIKHSANIKMPTAKAKPIEDDESDNW